ncbi:MAG: hypothetical protein ACOYYS_23180 [Chloroflexota bacterium]
METSFFSKFAYNRFTTASAKRNIPTQQAAEALVAPGAVPILDEQGYVDV